MVDDPISLPQPEFVSKRQDEVPEGPLYNLVQRRLPAVYHNAFIFLLQPNMVPLSGSTTNIYDAYTISNESPSSEGSKNGSNSSRILIEAASLSGLGAGLNHYLKHVCQVEMTWSGNRFDALPPTPPKLTDGQVLSGSSFVPWRYYMNVVTYGYSYAFWNWSRWEEELDWMMLNGVNMALAMVGQEYVFRQFYLNLGLTDQEIDSFLGGPAFTPWQRMGNLQGSWGYNSSAELHFKKRFYETQWVLQQKIIKRMRDFNMTAVLPSFNGFVPQAMTTKYPNVTYGRSSVWVGMPEQYTRDTYIPSTDPMFSTLSQQFIQLQTNMYNGFTSHYYLLDLYNELEPPCETLSCFTEVTSGVMKALKSADPQAIWVMQGWFLVNRGTWSPARIKAFFDGIKQYNNGRDCFVFDLYSDVVPLWKETEGYYGIDWGWSMLNNFGGGQGFYGVLPTLLTEPFAGYNQAPKSMRGMGITMEGINNNEFLYQLILDLPWHRADQQVNTPIDGVRLLDEFIIRRYGPNQTTPAMLEAWRKLATTVWDCRTGQMSQSKTYLDKTPALQMDMGGFMGTKLWYNKTTVVEAWEQLVMATETESWIRRRRHGPILNMVEDLFQAVMDPKNPEGAGAGNRSDNNKSRGKLTFTQRIRKSLEETLRSFSTRPSSTQVVVSSSDLAPAPQRRALSSPSTDEDILPSDGDRLDERHDLHSTLAKRQQTGAASSLLPPLPADAAATADAAAEVPLLPPDDDNNKLPLSVSSFRYDLIDVTREVLLGTLLPALQQQLVSAYQAKDASRVRFLGDTLLSVLDDTDRILSTHSHFMLGPWLVDARARALDPGLDPSSPWWPSAASSSSSSSSPSSSSSSSSSSPPSSSSKVQLAYEDYLEYNARNQITWWGPRGQGALADYASKHWGGLVRTYYRPRWQIFVDHLQRSLAPPSRGGGGGGPFDQEVYKRHALSHEAIWQTYTIAPMSGVDGGGSGNVAESTGMARVPTTVQEDTIQVAQDIWDRWGAVAKRVARGDRV